MEIDKNEEKTKYTRKMTFPIYEPKGRMPHISELVNVVKRNELIKDIEADKDLPEDLKNFLLVSAERHVSFNFSKIAEYYAHLNVKFKKHFENSALVIIDYDKAIRNGFIAFEKAVDESREEWLENEISLEKMKDIKERHSLKIDKLEEELDYIKSSKKQALADWD